MAISGSFYGTTSNGSIKPKITWSAEANIEGNYSDVTATLSYSRTDSYKTYGHWAGTLTIGGDKTSVSSKYVEITKNSNTVTITHTVQVPHNDDGTKTVTISATGSISGTTLSKTTISAEIELTSIPRAASVAATDADIGSVSVVTIGKKSDIYTYTVAYGFGDLSGYLSGNGLSAEAVHVTAASLAFPLPESFYYEIPDTPSALCTLTCTTYLDGAAIGTPQKCSFTVRADPARCGPVLTAAAEDANAETLALTGDKTTFIRYASTALCSMTAQARFGASIAHKKIAGKTVAGDTLTLAAVEAESVTFTAKDSRGYTTQCTLVLDLLPYFLPTVRISAARTDATSGEVTLKAEGSFYNEVFGAKGNSLLLQYRINDGEAVTLQPQIDGNSFALEQLLQGLDYTQSHRITVTASDAVGTAEAEVKINPGIPVFEWGKTDFRFHVPVYVQDQEVLSLVQEVADTCVRKTGDTLTGDLKMSGKRVTGLGTPQADTDAATKAYADKKLSMHLLWENASPTSSFAAQTLTVSNLQDYSYIWVLYNALPTATNWEAEALVPRQCDGIDNHTTQTRYDSGVYVCSRGVTVNFAANTVVFTSGKQNGATNESRMIPAYIFGMKGESA